MLQEALAGYHVNVQLSRLMMHMNMGAGLMVTDASQNAAFKWATRLDKTLHQSCKTTYGTMSADDKTSCFHMWPSKMDAA